MMAENTVEQLARELVSVRSAVIATPQIKQASLLLLDMIGCAIAGRDDGGAAAVLDAVTKWGGSGDCQIIGFPHRTSAPSAVLANGALCRAMDLNDYVFRIEGSQTRLGGHPSDNIPVALAFAELSHASGLALLQAIVIGYEVFGRAKSFATDAGEWDGVSYSGVVAPAIASHLLELTEQKTADALSISIARSATSSMVRTGHISSAKSIANALVAKSGAEAALLAASGVSGPRAVMDHKRGMKSLFGNAEARAALGKPFDDPSYIMNARIKPYPCVGTAQCAVEAAIQLHRRLHGDLSSVQKLQLEMGDHPTVVRHLADAERANPGSRESADHSIPFLIAVAIMDGELTSAQFSNERWHDPGVRALMNKIVSRTDAKMRVRAPENFACVLEAVTPSGTVSVEALAPPGWSQHGLVEDAVLEKFYRVTRNVLGRSAQEAIVQSVFDLPETPSISRLAAACAIDQAVDVKSS